MWAAESGHRKGGGVELVIVLAQDESFQADRQPDGSFLIVTSPVDRLDTRPETEQEKFDRLVEEMEPEKPWAFGMGHA